VFLKPQFSLVFCAEHEQLFKEFETQKLIENEAHICLQTYRSACRELFRTKYVIDYYNDLKINYCKLRDERLKEIIEEKVFNKIKENNIIICKIKNNYFRINSNSASNWSSLVCK